MHARHIVLAVLAAAVTLTSVASAGPAAAKQRVAVTAEVLGKAVLDPLQQGVLKRDAGTVGGVLSNTADRVVMRDGQKVEIYTSRGRSPENGEASRSGSGPVGRR